MAAMSQLKLRTIGVRDYAVLEGEQHIGRIRSVSERTPGIGLNFCEELACRLPKCDLVHNETRNSALRTQALGNFEASGIATPP